MCRRHWAESADELLGFDSSCSNTQQGVPLFVECQATNTDGAGFSNRRKVCFQASRSISPSLTCLRDQELHVFTVPHLARNQTPCADGHYPAMLFRAMARFNHSSFPRGSSFVVPCRCKRHASQWQSLLCLPDPRAAAEVLSKRRWPLPWGC